MTSADQQQLDLNYMRNETAKEKKWTLMVIGELTSVSLIGKGRDACNRRGIVEEYDLGTQYCMYGVND
jgi:hypothetical protein